MDQGRALQDPGEAAASDAGPRGVLRPGETCWRVASADRFGVIIDAADYFKAARAAMLEARESIVLVGWDFDLRIDLLPQDGRDNQPGDDAPPRLGDFLKYIARRRPDLRISILKWDMAVLFNMGRKIIPAFALDLMLVNRVRLRFDGTHPWMAAHHQKIVVIDDVLAFCGGIDMTTDRWDTRGHLPGDERRRRPDGTVAGPWHDATTVVDGEAARALGELARDRWLRATGWKLKAPGGSGDLWPEDVEPQLRDVEVGIARTMPEYKQRSAVREIEALYLELIRTARRCIYMESQYFASVVIAEAIAERLAEPDGPEVVVINPLTSEGWLEEQAMGTARDLRLATVRRADRAGRFGIFHPVNDDGTPIYVHAKVLIVDDCLIRVGSSNANNRSMGFDTECDLAVEARDAGQRAAIVRLRDDLLAEHLAVEPDTIRETVEREGSLLAAVEALRREEGRSLRPIPIRDVSEAQELLARSHLADPERPGRPEHRLVHIVKSRALRVPVLAWVAGAVLAVALVVAALV